MLFKAGSLVPRFCLIVCISLAASLISGCQPSPVDGNLGLAETENVKEQTSGGELSPPGLDDYATQIPLKNIKFGKYSVDQGLSQSSVSAIMQDATGLMWFGTEDGLNKFNGYDFSILKHDPENANSLSSNTIMALYEDSKGQLWIGTQSGLDRYDRQHSQWQHYPLDQVQAITEDSAGTLWVGSLAGLFKFEDGDKPGLIRSRSDNTFALLEDSQGILWVGTSKGLMKLDRSGEKLEHYQHRSLDDNSLVDDFVHTLYEDSDGILWIGTSGGLDKFDPSAEEFTHFVHNPNNMYSLSHNVVRALLEDRSGIMWVGTDGGLNRFDPFSRGFIHYQYSADDSGSLSSNLVRSIYQDQGGVIWIGTSAGGLNTYDVTQKNFVHYEYAGDDGNGLTNNLVFALFEDYSGILWIGTGGGGLNRLDRQLDVYSSYQHNPEHPGSLSDNFVTSVLIDSGGILWVGTANGGLNKFDPLTGDFIQFLNDPKDSGSLAHNSILSIFEDQQKVLWIGTRGGGLDSFDQENKLFKHHYGLTSQDVNVIFEDREGNLWVGTSTGGFSKYDPQRGTFTHYVHDPYDSDSLSANNILSIYQDQDEVFWIGTGGGGLNRFEPGTGEFKAFREIDGLPSDVVYGILADDAGYLWMSTNAGLSKFDPQKELFRNFDVLDGLQSNEFNRNAYFENGQGEMFFGGVNGFTSFFPEQIKDDPYITPIVLTSLTQSGGEVVLDDAVETIQEMEFHWPNNFFEFEFSALSYSQPEKNQYAYMLEGFRDEDWNYIGTKRFGRYTNLPGGTYTLRIKGSNKDGVWNEIGKSIQVKVISPFWMTWWFQTLVVLIVVVGIAAGYYMRLRSMQSRTQELEDQVSERTKELAALNSIASVVSRSLDLQKILNDALTEILEVLQLESGGIYLIQDDHLTLKIEAYQGLSEQFVSEINYLQVGEGFSGQVIQEGEVLVIPDVSADPRLTRSVVKEEGFHALVVLPLVSRARSMGTMFLLTHKFREFTEKDIELLMAIGGQLGGAIENAKFFEAEHRRSEQFRVLAEVGRRVSTILDVDQVLEEVVRLIRETFGYYHVAIGIVEGEDVVYRYGSGELWDDERFQFKPARLRVGQEGISGWVASTGKPLVVPDVSQEPRYVWMRGSQTRSELTVPILVKGEVIGILDTQSDQVNGFDDTDMAVLQSLAHQVGSAVENARLYEQAQHAAILEERARLARELHDAVTQTLFSASLLAEALPALWASDPQEGEKLLEELKQLNRGALAEMRTLLIELRPSALVEANFGELLQQLAEAASGREGLPITVKVDCECELPPDVHIALYRIAQEAVNNIVKHARATQVDLLVGCSRCSAGDFSGERPMKITLQVIDDGKGFDMGQPHHDQLGLGIMRERAADIGAQIEISSKPGSGTQVTVRWQESRNLR